MPAFLRKLVENVEKRSDCLRATLEQEATLQEESLKSLVERNWHSLPEGLFQELPNTPAFAVDGSVRVAGLANGAFLVVTQALCLGHGDLILDDVDVDILRGSLHCRTVQRFAELMQQYLEVNLALKCAERIPPSSILYLDGALYGQIPQLYPLAIESPDKHADLPAKILSAYSRLFEHCRANDVYLLSIAKTSHESVHWRLWTDMTTPISLVELPDAEAIYRWTSAHSGFSTPVILGTWGFVGGSRRLLADPRVQEAPAIVSFFVRMKEYDDPFRVDLPAWCMGDNRRLIDVEGEAMDIRECDPTPILRFLASDYGGSTVYNALLHSVDQEVRLTHADFRDVYLKVIEGVLGHDLPPDRSVRRFL